MDNLQQKTNYYIREIVLGIVLFPIAIWAAYIGLMGPENPSFPAIAIPVVLGAMIYYFYARSKSSPNPILASFIFCASGLVTTGIVFAYLLSGMTP